MQGPDGGSGERTKACRRWRVMWALQEQPLYQAPDQQATQQMQNQVGKFERVGVQPPQLIVEGKAQHGDRASQGPAWPDSAASSQAFRVV